MTANSTAPSTEGANSMDEAEPDLGAAIGEKASSEVATHAEALTPRPEFPTGSRRWLINIALYLGGFLISLVCSVHLFTALSADGSPPILTWLMRPAGWHGTRSGRSRDLERLRLTGRHWVVYKRLFHGAFYPAASVQQAERTIPYSMELWRLDASLCHRLDPMWCRAKLHDP